MTAILSVALAGCGGSDSDDKGGSSSSSGPKLTGTPIKVMTGTPLTGQAFLAPEGEIVAKAYESYINAHGGINGHPLQVEICDDKFDPNAAAACSRKAASNGDVAMVGNPSSGLSTTYIPPLQDAGIAWITPLAINPVDFDAPNSFPVGGFYGLLPSLVTKAADDGCKHISMIWTGIPIFQDHVTQVQSWGKTKGFDIKAVATPPGTTDLSSQVAETMQGDTDCIIGDVTDQIFPPFVSAMAAVGAKAKFYVVQGSPSLSVLEQFPDLLDGITWGGAFPDFSSDVFDDMRDELDKQGVLDKEGVTYDGSAALGTWASYAVFTEIAKSISGDVTAESFLDAANAASSVDTGGILPELNLSEPWSGLDGGAPRYFNREVIYSTWKDGEYSTIGDFTDASDAIENDPAVAGS